MEHKLKLYLDGSVPSAYFDVKNPERMRITQEFWTIKERFVLWISELTIREIDATMDKESKAKMSNLIKPIKSVLKINEEAIKLAELYVEWKAISPKYARTDALHIAVATLNDIDYLLSWNYRHIVKEKTRSVVNLVNASRGLREIKLITPGEII